MQKQILKQLSLTILLLTIAWVTTTADQTTDSPIGVEVNGEVVTRKIQWLYLTTNNEDGLRLYSSAPRVALAYAKTSDDAPREIDYIHPLVCRIVFGNVETGLNDLKLYEIQRLDADNLCINGLPEGETIRVYNASGRLCLTTRATANGAVVGIKSLPRDLYLIQAGKTTFKYMNRK